MRRDIVHSGAKNLSYAIREIVQIGYTMQELGQEIVWENIGDPIQKGEKLAPWIKQALFDVASEERSWGYCDTAGVKATRQFLSAKVNERPGGVQITPDDIIFFNGLGDAVSKVYSFIRREARVIGPTPAYSTHSSAEAAHSGYDHLTYELDPDNHWMPDLDDLRMKVKYNDAIAGILLINPDNPTGAVYPREVLEGMVAIAREFDLFVIADEIYAHIVYNGHQTLHLSQVIGDVPAIAMRGISKEFPWPGSRCGWIEVLNRDKDATFNTYVDSLLASKRLEVCSTTMPQLCIPPVIGDARYPGHLKARAEMFERRAREATEILSTVPGAHVNCPSGAFYITVTFDPAALSNRQTLDIQSSDVRAMVEKLTQTTSLDARFVYYLMGSTGICTVPLTGFCCKRPGFRATLLECDDEKRNWTFQTIADAMRRYLA
ncbi:MAG: pyridoxal phosphate-dependent aminotransferase [Phycisphaerae bacterium]|nr:pyridoxal phosphate-dependent aminotransferase [Phycisphaerae bacterium]